MSATDGDVVRDSREREDEITIERVPFRILSESTGPWVRCDGRNVVVEGVRFISVEPCGAQPK